MGGEQAAQASAEDDNRRHQRTPIASPMTRADKEKSKHAVMVDSCGQSEVRTQSAKQRLITAGGVAGILALEHANDKSDKISPD